MGRRSSWTCADALRPLVAQLQRDMQHWQHRSITRTLLNQVHATVKSHPAMRLSLLIINGSLLYGIPPVQLRHANPMLLALLRDLRELAKTYKLPDVEMVVNVDDYPFVSRRPWPAGINRTSLPQPLFSHYQSHLHADILAPSGRFRIDQYDRRLLRGAHHYRRRWPWTRKLPVAFWRGAPYCGIHRFGRCSRYVLPHLAAQWAKARGRSDLESDRNRSSASSGGDITLDAALTEYDAEAPRE